MPPAGLDADPGPAAGDGGEPSRRPWVVIGVIVLAAALLVGLFVVASDDDEPVAGSSGGDLAEEGDDSLGATGQTVDDVLPELIAFVEAERGLEFIEPVEVDLVSRDEFQRRIKVIVAEYEDAIRREDHVLTALGLLDRAADLYAIYTSFLDAGVAGFYDPETDDLVVLGAEVTPLTRQTLVHELVHALDDQHFDLADDGRQEALLGEESFGFSALVEGNARRIDAAYEEGFTPDEAAAAAREQLEGIEDFDIRSVPFWLLEAQLAPYDAGRRLVDQIIGEGGLSVLDQALADPPRTSEQVLHPDKYLADEEAADVSAPDPGRTIVREGALGELYLRLVLREAIGDDAAARAANGWGGDRYAAYELGGRLCVDLNVVGDTERDTDELLSAFQSWSERQPDAQVGFDGEMVRVSACV